MYDKSLRLYSRTAVVLGHAWREGLSARDLTSEMHEPWMPLLVSQRVIAAVTIINGLTEIQSTSFYGHAPWV